MKKKILIGSIIAVVILTLVSFSSVVGKVSLNEGLVEFDVEFCGLGKKQTVSLTQQEADEVELLFADIKNKLSEVETREEAEEIFKDAIIELDKYGLLGDLSVRQVNKLLHDHILSDAIKKYERLLLNILPKENDYNAFCLLAGRTKSSFIGPIATMYNNLGVFLFRQDYKYLSFLVLPLLLANMFNPLMIFNMITYGTFYTVGNRYVPADGWVITYGLNGNKNWETPIYGKLNRYPVTLLNYYWFPGVAGFTGIKLAHDYISFYVGFAPIVRLGNEPPYV